MRLAGAPELARKMGQAGRQRAEARFSMPAMVAAYQGVYDQQMRARGKVRGQAPTNTSGG